MSESPRPANMYWALILPSLPHGYSANEAVLSPLGADEKLEKLVAQGRNA